MKAKIVVILMVLFTGATMQLSAQHRDRDRYKGRDRERVMVVKDVPGHHRVVAYHGVNYHYADGRYYRPVNGGYERLAVPPAGIAVDFVPIGYKMRMHRGVRYYYSGNVCYRELRPHSYVVTARPW
ncbi:DUF6515 family protein [Chitinophaga sancti]|uniref:DUF6515 family protein n=1 Tax=Chitinophaga sancti TaxID=1004 RepID=A0A1K1S444_9BACT|nr:DUF6515 family protein [Chitinophaga sancti]WQD63769.1 DUF6515 family protein [Chitinophaga sancti]WQG90606.1 DUF6515 family protein [Chitinophaga sancti]SFW78954.1 hypothetical protein SAMN05661012_04692 [Chitinophaga sancti]